MKIATWNINSIRARLDRLLEWLKAAQPDVLCLQELKCTDDQFPHMELTAAGYHSQVFGQKTYNGVAILSKTPVTNVARNLGDDDEQSRVISATAAGVNVVGLYAPNGQSVGSDAYRYKLEWYTRLHRYLKRFPPTEPLLICGDFNIALHDIDVYSVPVMQGQTLFTEPEKTALQGLLTEHQLFDLFREHHPEPARFTWWDYRAGNFHKNLGLRIDYIFVNDALKKRCTAVDVDREARKGKLPSDHAPVWATFS